MSIAKRWIFFKTKSFLSEEWNFYFLLVCNYTIERIGKIVEVETLERYTNDRATKKARFAVICKALQTCDTCKFASIHVTKRKKHCIGCPVYTKLTETGSVLWEESARIERTLEKGEEMTTNEIMMLLELDVAHIRISRALGMNQKQFKDLCRGLTNGLRESMG